MKEKKEKILNLDEKIYLICYCKPRYVTEIAELLYQKQTQRYSKLTGKSGIISTMLKKNELKEIDMKVDTRDKRAKRRQYFQSEINPIFNSILTRLDDKKITLDTIETQELKTILDAPEFRNTICYFFPKKKIEGKEYLDLSIDINPIWFIYNNLINTASLVYTIRQHVNLSTKELMKAIDMTDEKNARKIKQKNKPLDESLKLTNISITNILENKEATKLFLRVKPSLLHKLMDLEPNTRISAGLFSLGLSLRK
jgi:hypothetical protein